jgi:hypothetical protein
MDHDPILGNKFGWHLQSTLDRTQIRVRCQGTELALGQRQFEGADRSIGDRGCIDLKLFGSNFPTI